MRPPPPILQQRRGGETGGVAGGVAWRVGRDCRGVVAAAVSAAAADPSAVLADADDIPATIAAGAPPLLCPPADRRRRRRSRRRRRRRRCRFSCSSYSCWRGYCAQTSSPRRPSPPQANTALAGGVCAGRVRSCGVGSSSFVAHVRGSVDKSRVMRERQRVHRTAARNRCGGGGGGGRG